MDAGELRVTDPDGRGQGIPVRPDELHRYLTPLGPELLVEGASVVLTLTAGAFPAFEHKVAWPASVSGATFTARRMPEGGLEAAWVANGEHEVLLLSILASDGGDLKVLTTCALDADLGRAIVERSVLEATGGLAGRVVRATFVRDDDVQAGTARVAFELHDSRVLAVE